MASNHTSNSFEALALSALRRSSLSYFDAKGRSFVNRARLADARSSLIAGRTNRAARRRAEVHEQRHPMIWSGSAA